MSLLVAGIQANPTTYYSPIVGKAITLATSVGTGTVNYVDVSSTVLPAGLYCMMIGNGTNGTAISSLVYNNGTVFSAGGFATTLAGAGSVSLLTAEPYGVLATANTSGAVINAGVYLIPMSLGIKPGMP